MIHPPELLMFVETAVFTKRIAALELESAVWQLQLQLLENPEAGDIDPGTGGLRKIRMADPARGKGKRGGARVHYLWLRHRKVIYLLYVYSKAKVTLSPQIRRDNSKISCGKLGKSATNGSRHRRSGRMRNEMFAELMESAHEALEHAQGKRSLRTTTLPRPPKAMNGMAVKRVRATLRASQAVFARYLNVSTKLVQAWEGNRRRPEGPALVLLHIAARQPEIIESVLNQSANQSRDPRQAGAGRKRAGSSSS